MKKQVIIMLLVIFCLKSLAQSDYPLISSLYSYDETYGSSIRSMGITQATQKSYWKGAS